MTDLSVTAVNKQGETVVDDFGCRCFNTVTKKTFLEADL